MRKFAAKLRNRLVTWVLGYDPRQELNSIQSRIEAVHVAISDAMLDLSAESREAVEHHFHQVVNDILKRNDLVIERVDRKAESLIASLSRRIGDLELRFESNKGDATGLEEVAD